MGLYIKGMEMPKEIEPALVIDFCEDLGGKRYARFYHYRYGGLTDWHEVIELHEPHGRLIDADAFAQRIDDESKKYYAMNAYDSGLRTAYRASIRASKLAPAIIPASLEE